jgi:hypothetical protein
MSCRLLLLLKDGSDAIDGRRGIEGFCSSSGLLLLPPRAAARTLGLALLRPNIPMLSRATRRASKLPFDPAAAVDESDSGRGLLLLLGVLKLAKCWLVPATLLVCSCHEMRAERCLWRCCKLLLLLRAAGNDSDSLLRVHSASTGSQETSRTAHRQQEIRLRVR